MFLRCEDAACNHCHSCPVRATRAVQLLRSLGGRLFSPTLSTTNPGHYLILEECRFWAEIGKPLEKIDGSLPSKTATYCKFGCQYAFSSHRDEDRHYHLVHEAQLKAKQQEDRLQQKASASSTNQPPAKKACHRCTYEGCQMVFTSSYQLRQHKKDSGHLLGKGRPKKNV